MSEQMLATKLYIPPPRSSLVPRPHLLERMESAAARVLTLVSAPAGFGKTTLLSGWVSSSSRRICWLSLDRADNDPARFFAYLIATIRTIEPDFGTEILNLLQAQKTSLNESMLMSLVNDLAAIHEPFSLVLDDYHVIESDVIDDAIHFLLENLPPTINLVISSRTDPNFPLARLRASGALSELRASDLKFNKDEIAVFFNDVMGLMLQDKDLQALWDRTEGWVASLQLAALSLQGTKDKSAFLADFSGDHHYVIDYLVDEVMTQLPDETRTFLLRTSILERFCAPLCDAVVGNSKSKEILQRLDDANFFLIPLDDRRLWYRFHHLFADFLHQLLRQGELEEVKALHRRAAGWFKEQQLEIEAVEHAIKGEDYPFAAQLIENLGPELMMASEFDLLSRWLGSIPESFVETWPWLCIINAWMYQRWAQMDVVVKYLDHAEAVVLQDDPEEKKESTRIVMGQVCTIRSLLPPGYTDMASVISNANRALELLPENYFNRGAAAIPLGRIYREQGAFIKALSCLNDGYQASLKAHNRILAQALMLDIGRTFVRQGKLHQAVGALRDAMGIKYLETNIEIPYAGTAGIMLGEILYERNDLEAAEAEIRKGMAIGEENLVVETAVRGHLALSRLMLANGNLESANDEWNDALQISQEFPGLEGETCEVMIATRTRLLLAENQPVHALDYLALQGLHSANSQDGSLTIDQIALTRALLHAGRDDPSSEFLSSAESKLNDQLEKSRSAGFDGTTVALLTLMAQLQYAQTNVDEAVEAAIAALKLAEPENMIRVFLDEGDLVRELLQLIRPSSGGYIRRVLDAFDTPLMAKPSWREQGLLDPLSERELEVLHMLATDLSGPDIAKELIVSLNTMRTHTKRIYSKLGVNSRREAVRRAKELSL